VLGLVTAGPALAGKKLTPNSLPGATVVDADQVKAMIDKKEKVLVVDARVESEYKEAHLPGAVNIPQPKMDALKDRLPADKTHPLLFYCNGPKCWKSYRASKKALEWGYTQVYWFRGGIPEWKSKGYPTE